VISYNNNCGTRLTNVDQNAGNVRLPDIDLFVTPDRYTLNEQRAEWRIYVTNIGAGTAGSVTVTNALGAGLQFITYTATLSDKLTLLPPQNGTAYVPGEDVVWLVRNLESFDQIQIDVDAVDAVSCSNLTTTVTVDPNCYNESCQPTSSEPIEFVRPPIGVRSQNFQTADLGIL
jgi:uncharacterized repeat protein (TIGR01451 family)